MNTIQNKLIVLLFLTLAFPYLATSQDRPMDQLEYEVNKIYEPFSMTKEELKEAKTLVDLNKQYKPSWIKEYISVEVLAKYKGKTKRAVSKNGVLSQKQKDIMNIADVGTDISITVRYLPNNTLKNNDSKEINFEFIVNPESSATYLGGQQGLNQYLEDNAINEIPVDHFSEFALAAVKFSVDEKGQVVDAHVFETSKDEKIDKLLLKAIRNMPNWKPAEYSNGTKAKQEFVLTVGNMKSCVVNLLNIRGD